MSALALAAGIAVIVWPGRSFEMLLWVLGIWMVVHGMLTVIAALRPHLFDPVELAGNPTSADPRHTV
jgi:hypothetical protein